MIKRRTLSLGLLGAFLVATLSVQSASAAGSPFDAVWRAVRTLQRKVFHLEQQVEDLAGIPGPQGEQGPVGPQGDIGPVGLQGLPGDNGQPGTPGAQGEPGLDGQTGLDGAQGLPGAQGPAGAQGIQGIAGPQGIQGLTGPAGSGLVRSAVYKTEGSVSVPPGAIGGPTAECTDANDVLLSGGFRASTSAMRVYRNEPLPFFANQTWTVSAQNTGALESTLFVYAFCLTVE
ncbi:MAG: hypothetical protein Q8O51_02480 [bacterium]|nr:hypothetical protein [bacterium]